LQEAGGLVYRSGRWIEQKNFLRLSGTVVEEEMKEKNKVLKQQKE
jgi:hypothetical protein